LTLALALVIPVLARAPAEAIDLAAVLTGRQIATIALPDAGIPADPAWTAMSVRAVDGSRLQIAGRLPMVLLGEVADWILVPVRRPEGGLAVAALDTSRAEVRRVPAGDLDFAKPTTEVIVDGAWIGPEHLLGAGAEDLTGLLTDWLRRYLVCVDAESVGGAAEAIHRTVTYVCERRQFGVPVGSFQAVKHIMADAYGEMESARGLARHVAWRLDHDPEPPDDDLICSRLLAGTMYPSVIERCIQCHGGAGFTWEQGLHRWYRQALFHRSHPFSRRALRDHLWQRVRAGMADTVSA
jgi:alkylation response protein AidB-like acyl-CoA dehydrogenase